MFLKFGPRLTILFTWVVVILLMLLSPMPYSGVDENVSLADKIVHAFLFGVLTFLIHYLLRVKNHGIVINPNKKSLQSKKKKTILVWINNSPVIRIFLIATIFSICLSVLLEYIQMYVPGRSSNDLDFIASVIGIILMLLFIYGAEYYKYEHK